MDNSLKTKEKPSEEGASAPPAKGKPKTFLTGKKLKTNNLRHTAAERGNRNDKPNPKARIASAKGQVTRMVSGARSTSTCWA